MINSSAFTHLVINSIDFVRELFDRLAGGDLVILEFSCWVIILEYFALPHSNSAAENWLYFTPYLTLLTLRVAEGVFRKRLFVRRHKSKFFVLTVIIYMLYIILIFSQGKFGSFPLFPFAIVSIAVGIRFTEHIWRYTQARKAEKVTFGSPLEHPKRAIVVFETRQKQYESGLLHRQVSLESPGAINTPDDQSSASATTKFTYAAKEYVARGCALPTPTTETAERRLFPYFFRCSCCITIPEFSESTAEADVDTEVPSRVVTKSHRQWCEERDKLLAYGSNGAATHHLCSRCEELCSQSRWIKVFTKTSIYNPFHPQTFSLQPVLQEDFEHYTDPQQLAKSAQLDCHLCTLIWDILNAEQQSILLAGDLQVADELKAALAIPAANGVERRRIEANFRQRRSIRIRIILDPQHTIRLIPHFGGTKSPRRWQVRTDVAKEPLEGFSETAPPLHIIKSFSKPNTTTISPNTGSDFSMLSIRSWLHKTSCNPCCDWIPSRLINVRESETTGAVKLKWRNEVLQQAEGNTRYIALSHTWGCQKFITLTKENLSVFEEGVEVNSLSKSFQDAISATRRLGYDYIWVDSLCIIQNSQDDWIREAYQMSDVYRHADCTIVAAAATGSDGFFTAHNPLATRPCLLTADLKQAHLVSCGRSDKFFYVLPSKRQGSEFWDDIKKSKLNSRAWCLQEQLLSRRLVYFGQGTVYLEEKEEHQIMVGTRVGGNARGELAKIMSLSTLRDLKSMLQHTGQMVHLLDPDWLYGAQDYTDAYTALGRLNESDPRRALNETWWDIVNQYSQRDLTKQEDKLVAIQGVAVYLDEFCFKSTARNEDYIAGLWSEYIIAGLLWYVDLGRARTRPQVYRAPSWSWASVDGTILNCSLELQNSTSGVEVRVISPHGPHPMAQQMTDLPESGQDDNFLIAMQGHDPGPSWSTSYETRLTEAADFVFGQSEAVENSPNTSISCGQDPSSASRGKQKALPHSPIEEDRYQAIKASSTAPSLFNSPPTANSTSPSPHMSSSFQSHHSSHLVRSQSSLNPTLSIRGRLQKAAWRRSPPRYKRYYMAQCYPTLTPDTPIKWDEDSRLFNSISRDPRSGPEIYDLITSNSPLGPSNTNSESMPGLSQKIGYFLPDTTTDLPEEVYCLRVTVEPASEQGKRDPYTLWVVRGLALRPKRLGADVYERVGYFELCREEAQLLWPDVLTGPLNTKNAAAPIRKRPNVDPYEFFRGEGLERTIILV